MPMSLARNRYGDWWRFGSWGTKSKSRPGCGRILKGSGGRSMQLFSRTRCEGGCQEGGVLTSQGAHQVNNPFLGIVVEGGLGAVEKRNNYKNGCFPLKYSIFSWLCSSTPNNTSQCEEADWSVAALQGELQGQWCSLREHTILLLPQSSGWSRRSLSG